MNARLTRSVLLALVACASAPSVGRAQSVQVHGTQLELGLDGALPLAARGYERAVGLGGGLTARFTLSRGRAAFDAGLVVHVLTVHERWFMGDGNWLRNGSVARLRAMLGARYALASGEHAQLYARLAVGVESRVGLYDRYGDDPGSDGRRRDLSWAPVVEPSLGLRLGGAKTFMLVQVALPLAFHRLDPIRLHGDYSGSLAVDLCVSLWVGVTL